MSIISVVSMHSVTEPRADDHSTRTIALFCGVGLLASFCLIASGFDLGAGWI